MMTRINELSEDKHINMTYVEFMEAVARIADKCNFNTIINFQDEQRNALKPEKIVDINT